MKSETLKSTLLHLDAKPDCFDCKLASTLSTKTSIKKLFRGVADLLFYLCKVILWLSYWLRWTKSISDGELFVVTLLSFGSFLCFSRILANR